MTKSDDIIATEKLLDIIRTGQNSSRDISRKTYPDLTITAATEPSPAPREAEPFSIARHQTDTAFFQEPKPLTLEHESSKISAETTLDLAIEPDTPLHDIAINGQDAKHQSRTATAQESKKNAGRGVSDQPTARWKPLTSIINAIPWLPTACIGVDIQPASLNIARVVKKGRQSLFQDYIHAPYDNFEVPQDADILKILQEDWFKKLLTEKITAISRSREKKEIWCTLANDYVDTYNISIPRVPEKEIANAVYWSAKKETSFDETQVIFDFTLLGAINVKGVDKLSTVVFLASRKAVDAFCRLFREIGAPLTGLTTHANAIQNLIRAGMKTDHTECISHLHIGNHKSYIDIYSANRLIFSRGINTGMSSFTETLQKLAHEKGYDITDTVAREIAFQTATPSHNPDPVVQALGEDGLNKLQFNLPASRRLLRQLQRTFDYCATNYGVPKADTLVISGQPSQSEHFLNYTKNELGIECLPLDPFKNKKNFLGKAFPANVLHRHFLVSALGLTSSSKDNGQNFLFTDQDKAKARTIHYNNKIVLTSFAVLMLIVSIFFFQQHLQLSAHETKLTSIKKETRQHGVVFDSPTYKTLLLGKIKNINEIRQTNWQTAVRFLPVALLTEFSQNLSPDIKLLSIAFSVDTVRNVKEGADTAGQKSDRITMTLTGFVTGKPENLELILAGLLKKISDSIFVAQPAKIEEKTIKEHNGQPSLYFLLTLRPALLTPTGAAKG